MKFSKNSPLDSGYTITPGVKIDKAKLAAYYAGLVNDDVKFADHLRMARAASVRGSAAIGGAAATETPVLNATKAGMEKSLLLGSRPENSRVHALGERVSIIKVKPNSGKAAALCDGWNAKEWAIHRLRWSRGFVLVSHKGVHSVQVWKTVRELYNFLKSNDLNVV